MKDFEIGAQMEEDDFEFDEVKGAHGRKPKMAILNKKRINSFEMDELFLEF